jgi:AraC-like DNA-binding protein
LAHLRRARDLLDREYARPLDVPAMARAALMSPSLFSRRFREAYGDTPYAATNAGLRFRSPPQLVRSRSRVQYPVTAAAEWNRGRWAGTAYADADRDVWLAVP